MASEYEAVPTVNPGGHKIAVPVLRERLGAKRRIEHGIPNSPSPETLPSIEGRLLPPVMKRTEQEIAFPNGGQRWVDSDEGMGGHSMHTGDNSNGSSSPSDAALQAAQDEYNRKVKMGIDPKRIPHGA